MQNNAKNLKNDKTPDSTQRELSNEYQQDRV